MIDKTIIDALEILQGDPITFTDRNDIIERVKKKLDGMNRTFVDYDIFH